jgi:glycosyltransferase involved in cell wall biosynthesis
MSSDDLPTVSVAIWTCDQEAFIGEAIESALAQAYPRLEIVIADDHSLDATPRIVTDYAKRHPEVIKPVLHTGPRSIVGNVNRALAACSGEFVALLEGDDMYLPGKLHAQVEAFANEPDVVICRHPVEVFDNQTNAVLRIEDPNPKQKRAEALDLVAKGNFVPTASSMMRRAAMPPAGAPPTIEIAPDWILAIETARGGTILRIPEVLARYRIHPQQITNVTTGDEAVFLDAMYTLTYVEERFPELTRGVRSGRRVVSLWEAHRRVRRSADIGWIRAGLRAALRHDPANARLWGVLIKAHLNYLMRKPRRLGR